MNIHLLQYRYIDKPKTNGKDYYHLRYMNPESISHSIDYIGYSDIEDSIYFQYITTHKSYLDDELI